MTTENLTTTTFPQLPEVAHQLREQILSSVKDQNGSPSRQSRYS